MRELDSLDDAFVSFNQDMTSFPSITENHANLLWLTSRPRPLLMIQLLLFLHGVCVASEVDCAAYVLQHWAAYPSNGEDPK